LPYGPPGTGLPWISRGPPKIPQADRDRNGRTDDENIPALVPWAVYRLLFEAESDEYAFLIIAPLFWVFGFWGVGGPLVGAYRVRALMRSVATGNDALARAGSCDAWTATTSGRRVSHTLDPGAHGMDELIDRIFAIAPAIRYVAVYRDGRLRSSQRPGIAQASASESDKYEELIVNPTLLTLTRQRGDIDCGGLEFVVIRYGSFYELVLPLSGGHLSVGIEPEADPLELIPRLRAAAGAAGPG